MLLAKRDFYCRRAHLVKEMSYFANHLHDKRLDDLIEIDVHCDVEVFEWLMSYISKKNSALEPRTVISVLISSNFLQMVDLEEACLNFIHAHLNHVIQVPIDMRCVPGMMIQRYSFHGYGANLCYKIGAKNEPRGILANH